ncbi:peptide ABC transporter ATP-binding protein [Halobacteriales archaeon SW_7_68_16]|nr:MAG: peptide ABC transporter ATP-binding protein [Halobacteriales archaeon SW_7_68_16]
MSDTERPDAEVDSGESVREDPRAGTAVDDPLVQVRGVKTYYEGGGLLGGRPVKAVDGVDFDIRRGETLGLVGESGCGKTTLGRTLIQLENATEGEVLFEGTDVTELSGAELKEWRRNTQMVFQDPESSLNDRMTVGEIVREPLDVHAWNPPRERRERVRELLSTVGLQREHYFRYPHQFSGGQRQRVGIARALALEPEFVVLDLQDEFELTYLFIAHDLSVVKHICDRVAVMYLGNIMEMGETEDLFREPKNPYTHSLLSAIPRPDPTGDRDRVILRGTPPSPRFPPTGCPFSTRCPGKIRPDEYADLDPAVWEAIETFREVIRERARAERSLREIAAELLGRETRFSDVDEITEELFGDLAVSADAIDEISTAADLVAANDDRAAEDHLREQFGSRCDRERPDHHEVSDTGRTSLCHRHDANEEDVEAAFDRVERR